MNVLKGRYSYYKKQKLIRVSEILASCIMHYCNLTFEKTEIWRE